MSKYRKSRAFSPEGFFECEGRGLQWLGEAQSKGGPRVVDVYDWGKDYLNIERVTPVVRLCRPRMISALLSRVCMMPEPITLDLPQPDIRELVISAPCRIPFPWTQANDDVATYLAEGRLRPMVQLGMKRRELTDYDMELTEASLKRCLKYWARRPMTSQHECTAICGAAMSCGRPIPDPWKRC